MSVPDYYSWHPSGVECKVIAREFPFNLGCAIKYIWRNGRKSGEDAIKDLRKAIDYLEDELVRLEKEK